MAGITSNGFVKKTLAEIKLELEETYRTKYGKTINLRPPSLMATQIGIQAEREAAIWDVAEECWNARGPSTAQGVSLDNVGEMTATARIRAEASRVLDQYLFGDPGAVIPSTATFSVDGNPSAKFKLYSAIMLDAGVDAVQKIEFSAVPDAGTWTITLGILTTAPLAFGAVAATVQAAINLLADFEDVTVSGDYSVGFTLTFAGLSGKQPQALAIVVDSLENTAVPVDVTVSNTTVGVPQGVGKMVAIEVGPVSAPAKTLSVIDTPVTGLTRTFNATDATIGRLTETDAEYRIRRADELENSGASTLEAIRTKLKQVAGVAEAIVFENNTMVVDGDGRPPKSIHAYVDGGENQAIADQLWRVKAGGIEPHGDISVNVTDSQGGTQLVKFSRPVQKNVYIILDVVKDAALFPVNGVNLLKDAAVAYGTTLKIGEEVLVYPKLLPAIVSSVPGIVDIAIKIGFAPGPTLDDNLIIAANEIAKFDTSRITVNVT